MNVYFRRFYTYIEYHTMHLLSGEHFSTFFLFNRINWLSSDVSNQEENEFFEKKKSIFFFDNTTSSNEIFSQRVPQIDYKCSRLMSSRFFSFFFLQNHHKCKFTIYMNKFVQWCTQKINWMTDGSWLVLSVHICTCILSR